MKTIILRLLLLFLIPILWYINLPIVMAVVFFMFIISLCIKDKKTRYMPLDDHRCSQYKQPLISSTREPYFRVYNPDNSFNDISFPYLRQLLRDGDVVYDNVSDSYRFTKQVL